MKIVVVSYAEMNERPLPADVVNDVVSFYKSIDGALKAQLGSVLNEQLFELSRSHEADVTFIDSNDSNIRNNLVERINSISPNLVVSYNLAGFEISTLTDGLGYNLVNARQFHFVKNVTTNNNQYLVKKRSINMFVIKMHSYIEKCAFECI